MRGYSRGPDFERSTAPPRGLRLNRIPADFLGESDIARPNTVTANARFSPNAMVITDS